MIREHNMRLTRTVLLGAALGLLVSCSSFDSTQPDGDPSLITANWGIEFPESAEAVRYYSSESDFQGGREDVYIIAVEEADRSGYWDESEYLLTASEGERSGTSPESIAETAGVSLDEGLVASLECREPEGEDQNYLMACFNPEDGDFYIFEELF